MTRRNLQPMRPVADALRVLGMQVRESRIRKNLTAAELAGRSMVSARTVSLIERGDPSVSIGNALTVAMYAGVPLFGADTPSQLPDAPPCRGGQVSVDAYPRGASTFERVRP